jgi:hypothetical protein
VLGRYSPAACLGARKISVEGRPDPKHISTSYSERNNLNVRMHCDGAAFPVLQFCPHSSDAKNEPATAAGVTKRLWEMKDVVDMLEAWEAAN